MSRLALVLIVLALAGCDRQRIDPFDSRVEVLSPDLGLVLLDADLALRFDTISPVSGPEITINGQPAERDSVEGGFRFETRLDRGLNALRVRIEEEDGSVQTDTLYALHLPARLSGPITVSSSVRRDGAAAAALGGGQALISGGVGASGLVAPTATVVTGLGSGLSTREVDLVDARTGHTASVLPDGSVLLLGGVRRADPDGPDDLVTGAERVSLAESQSAPIGPATVQRAGHTARVLQREGRTYVYLIGGLVPSGGALVPSATADIYEYVVGEVGQLVRLSPDGGVGIGIDGRSARPLVGATTAPVGVQESVVYGLDGDGDPVAQRLSWRVPGTTYPFSLVGFNAAALGQPRTDAAAVDAGDGLAVVTGGRGPTGSVLTQRTLEVYVRAIDRTFGFPSDVELGQPRAGHTATNFGGGRILVAGGRGPSGATVPTVEIIQL